jgi:anti-sigma regulatory factor (Ser/Thr protein kinase)
VTLDPVTRTLSYSCLGHPPPLRLDCETGEVVRLDRASGPPMGVAGPADVVEATLPLPGRAAVVMYTDGLIERRGMNIDETIDLLGSVVATAAKLTPDAILARVAESIGAPDDDVALLVLALDLDRVTFEVEIPPEPTMLRDLRHRLHAWLAGRGVDPDAAGDVVLAVSEACNNAIEHAYRDNGAGPITVSADGEAGRVQVVVEDRGTWRDAEPSDERGRGIVLMERLMNSTDIQTGLNGTRVTLERRLDGRAGVAPEYAPTAAP